MKKAEAKYRSKALDGIEKPGKIIVGITLPVIENESAKVHVKLEVNGIPLGHAPDIEDFWNKKPEKEAKNDLLLDITISNSHHKLIAPKASKIAIGHNTELNRLHEPKTKVALLLGIDVSTVITMDG